MLVLRRRLAVAGVIAATAIAVPAAALASSPGSPSGKPGPPSASAPSGGKQGPAPSGGNPEPVIRGGKTPPKQPPLAALAASAGITVRQLEAGLEAAKQAGGNDAAGIAAFAASTGVSNATAQRIVDAVFGTEVAKRPGQTGPSPVSALAAKLGVSQAAAKRALSQLQALGRGIDPASPAFAAIAHGLGVSPERLAAALTAVKQGMAGS